MGGGGGGLTVVRQPKAHKVDHAKFTFTSPSKKQNSSCLGRIPSEKPRFVCLPVQTRAVWPNGGVLSFPCQLYELLW